MSRNRHLLLKIIITSIIVLLLGIFVFFNARLFIKGPEITIYGPQNGSSFADPLIELSGKALNVSYISLDDDPIFIDEAGNFKEKLLLSPGLSIMKLYARDKFGREETILLQYIYNGTVTPRNEIQIEREIETGTTTEEVLEEIEE